MYLFYPGEFNWKEVLHGVLCVLQQCLLSTQNRSHPFPAHARFLCDADRSRERHGVPRIVFFRPYRQLPVEGSLSVSGDTGRAGNRTRHYQERRRKVSGGAGPQPGEVVDHEDADMLTKITILTGGLATFVPVIQEFSIFAIVGLLWDFVLQMRTNNVVNVM
ncbi:uncharacterized protein LOC131216604 [Anopheles bellator]|uniref:uncharacterized protein LOC131216604 n=1 Tax=Anopheles bellator TaxID=139047 RepID=UPI0026473C7F|nr:uncharacterized protein LOC131216604 [Anopheles bellator]